MKTQNTLLFALICGAVWSANAVDQTKTPGKNQFQKLLETIDWDHFKRPMASRGEGIEYDLMNNLGNSSQDMPNNQNPHSETVDQSDEERKSDTRSISSNTRQDGNDSFELVEDEESWNVKGENQTGSHNASFLGTFNEVSSSFTSYMSDCAGSVMNKAKRMMDIIMDKDLEQAEALKSAMVDMGLETEKLKSLLARQEREIENKDGHNEELQKQLELQKKKMEATESQLKFAIKKCQKNGHKNDVLKKQLELQKKENEQLRSQQSEMYPTVDEEELQWIEEDAQAQQSTTIDEFHDMAKKGVERYRRGAHAQGVRTRARAQREGRERAQGEAEQRGGEQRDGEQRGGEQRGGERRREEWKLSRASSVDFIYITAFNNKLSESF